MINKQALLDLIGRAEHQPLLWGEAQVLRDAVELLEDLSTLVNKISRNEVEVRALETIRGYHAATTQEMRIIDLPGCDDHGGNRP